MCYSYFIRVGFVFMLAVIKTGGKQYIVKEGTTLNVEKLPGVAGGKVVFDQVLLLADDPAHPDRGRDQSGQGGEVRIGTPTVSGARVEGTIVAQGRAPKITVIKYKRKVRYKRKRGHRQEFTKVKIERIGG